MRALRFQQVNQGRRQHPFAPAFLVSLCPSDMPFFSTPRAIEAALTLRARAPRDNMLTHGKDDAVPATTGLNHVQDTAAK